MECDPFGIDEEIETILDLAVTNVVSNTNCTDDVYVQQSIVTSNNLITKCFSTYSNSRCNSTFGVMTLNGTMFVDFIEQNNDTYINMNNFLIHGGTYGMFNVSNGTALIESLDINGTLYIDVLDSCVNDSVIIDGLIFYENGTLIVPNVNATNVNITALDSLAIIGGIDVQGVLISRGGIQGYSGGSPSNILFNPTAYNVGFGYSSQNVALEQKVNVNGTITTDAFQFYPNNCTENENCILDYYYEWSGYINVTGLDNGTSLPIAITRIGRSVNLMFMNISDYVTGNPVIISGSFVNGTGPLPFNYTNFFSSTKTVNQNINFWVPSLNIVPWAQVSIDRYGILRIYVNPFYSFSSTPFYWNKSTIQYNI
jgi:hypothetical protein